MSGNYKKVPSRFIFIRKSFDLLDKSDLHSLSRITLVQISLAILDLVGVACIGLLGALTVRGIRSEGPGNRLHRALELI
jgi:ATP-binding cassette subfamily C protein